MLCYGLMSALFISSLLFVQCTCAQNESLLREMLWEHSHLKDQHPVTGNSCVYTEAALFFAVPVIEPKCCEKDCICPLSQPQKNKSSVKLLWCISQSIIFQDISVSFTLSQPRLLCQVVVGICTEISKYFLSIPDTNISHLVM